MSKTYSPNVKKPAKRRNPGSQALLCIVLLLLLPPIGLIYLWYSGVFLRRGQVILSIIATIEMAFLFTLFTPSAKVQKLMPEAHLPVAATVAPDDGASSALDNIDEVLRAEQAAATPDPDEVAAEATEVPDSYRAEQKALLDEVVYTVRGNSAKYYHSIQDCSGQNNSRELTLREALNLGMGACPNCDPPIYKETLN